MLYKQENGDLLAIDDGEFMECIDNFIVMIAEARNHKLIMDPAERAAFAELAKAMQEHLEYDKLLSGKTLVN